MPPNAQIWNLPAPPGFQGLRDDLPLERYVRHLCHWRQPGASYFVTFRLADSLPRAQITYLQRLRAEWERRHPHPRSDQDWESIARQTMRLAEKWLDAGSGECILGDPANSEIVASALGHFDKDNRAANPNRYELGCYVVMPNHVHAVVRPLDAINHPLENILHSWKSYTAKRINARRNQRGDLWQRESFDRILRDEEHLWRTVQYVGRNPGQAKLPAEAFRLWIRPDWKPLGWNFQLP